MTALLLGAGVLCLAVVASALLEPRHDDRPSAGATDGEADKPGRRGARPSVPYPVWVG